MKNLVFVIWMLGFPLIDSIDRYLNSVDEDTSDNIKGWNAILTIVTWVIVSILLYER